MPSLKWPLIWLATTGYLVVSSFIDFTVDREEDAGAAFLMFPIMVGLFLLALRYHAHRIAQRKQWREEREMQAILNMPDIPEPTNWQAYEKNVEWALENGLEYTIGGGWHGRDETPFAKGGLVKVRK